MTATMFNAPAAAQLEPVLTTSLDPVITFCAGMRDIIDRFEATAARLRKVAFGVPDGGVPAERLAPLVELWKDLGIDNKMQDPPAARGEMLLSRLERLKTGVPTIVDAIRSIEMAIGMAMDDGARDETHTFVARKESGRADREPRAAQVLEQFEGRAETQRLQIGGAVRVRRGRLASGP